MGHCAQQPPCTRGSSTEGGRGCHINIGTTVFLPALFFQNVHAMGGGRIITKQITNSAIDLRSQRHEQKSCSHRSANLSLSSSRIMFLLFPLVLHIFRLPTSTNERKTRQFFPTSRYSERQKYTQLIYKFKLVVNERWEGIKHL